jgi:hypothetical protein
MPTSLSVQLIVTIKRAGLIHGYPETVHRGSRRVPQIKMNNN